MPKLRTIPFQSAIIERYMRRKCPVEEVRIEMYLAKVSVRSVEDITRTLWGTRASVGLVARLNKQIYEKIEPWCNRALDGRFPSGFVEGLVLKRTWAEEVRKVSILVAFVVNEDGSQESIGAAEGAKEGWSSLEKDLKSRGLEGVRLFIVDTCIGLMESLAAYYPRAPWQCCCAHFYRNVFTSVPHEKVADATAIRKAIHGQEDRQAAVQKAALVVDRMRVMKLPFAARTVEEGISEILTDAESPREQWRKARTNNPMERAMREIRRRTRVVGNFSDGNSTLVLVRARLRYVAGRKWGTRKYLNRDLLTGGEASIESSRPDL